MTSRHLIAASLLAAAAVTFTPDAARAAATNCGSAASQGATQGAGLGPSCEGQQPTTTTEQGTTSGAPGAGTGTTPNGPGGSGGGAAPGVGSTGGSGSGTSGAGGTSGGGKSK